MGCAAGALIAVGGGDGGEVCLAGAAAGGAIGGLMGAAGGSAIADNQEGYAAEEARLEALSQSAGDELAQAWADRAVIERLVASHAAELRVLKGEAMRDAAAIGRLEVALGEAAYDRDRIAAARNDLDYKVAILDEASASPAADGVLIKRRDALRREVELLDGQIRALTDEIEAAQGIV
jgi:hypothetical protein